MCDKCSILGTSLDFEEAVGAVENIFGVDACRFSGLSSDWTRIDVVTPSGTLVFERQALRSSRNGNNRQFADVLSGLHEYFELMVDEDPEYRAQLLRWIADVNLVVGVHAVPFFSADEHHFAGIFEVARVLRGLVFNGYVLMDDRGRLLYDAGVKSK